MTTLVLAAAGAVIGSAFGPLGASIGWSIGAYLGGRLDPPKIEGPKLHDLQLQRATYGAPIPIFYGSYRAAGNIIWQTELHPHENKTGGKGGGPETTLYTYSASFALMIGAGPIGGIGRIWWNSRLVRDPNDPEIPDLPITIYLGDESQLPDPLMEADKGVGNVPAHRGSAYVVFNELDLSPGGNAIGNWEFEIVSDVVVNCPIESVAQAQDGNAPTGGWESQSNNNDLYPNVVSVTPTELGGYEVVTSQAPRHIWGVSWTAGSFGPHIDHGGWGAYAGPTHLIGDSLLPVWWNPNQRIGDYEQNRWCLWFGGSTPTASFWLNSCGMRVVDYGQYDATSGFRRWYVSNGYGAGACVPEPLAFGTPIRDNGLPAGQYIRGLNSTNDGRCLFVFTGTTASYNDPAEFWHMMVNGVVVRSGPIDYQNMYYGFGVQFTGGGSFSGQEFSPFSVSEWENNARYMWSYFSSATSGVRLYWINDSGLLVELCPLGSSAVQLTTPGIFSIPAISAFTTGKCVVVAKEHWEVFQRTTVGEMTKTPVPLSEIVADISEREGGLTAGQYDVSALTDMVDGYAITTRMDKRAALQPLAAAFFFDAVESDGKVKFVKRGGTSVVTIPEDDLAACAYGDASPPALAVTRKQESDLARSVEISYINFATDYQPGLQRAQRLTGDATQDIALQFAVVMSDDYAKRMADALLYSNWVERDEVRIAVTRKYAALEPTDAVTVRGRTLRLTQRLEQPNGIIVFDAVPSVAGIWQTGATSGGSDGFIQPEPLAINPTEALLLNIPLVEDTDAANGFYAAMAGVSSKAWAGAVLYVSKDDGTTYIEIDRADLPTTIGTTTNELGAFYGGNIFDELNMVAVVLTAGSGELESATEGQVLGGANRALIGDEMIQFKTATLTGTRTYRLSGLLRGRRGTEWAMTEHTEADRFVLLPTSSNPATPFEELGNAYRYKAVTIGSVLDTASVHDFTNTGIALRPYAPVLLGGGRYENGDVRLTWVRRERVRNGWVDYVDVPSTDPLEYTVTIYDDSTYATPLRTIDVTAFQYATYTAAMQAEDFGSPIAGTIYWSVTRTGTYSPSLEARGSI